MTREEAIKNLKYAIRWNDMPKKEALDVAIKALKQMPCEEELDFVQEHKKISCNLIVESCEDAISREAALEALDCEINGNIESDIDLSKHKREFQEFANMILNAQEKAIQALPPVTPQQKTVQWIEYDHGLDAKYYQCPICKGFDGYGKEKYCKWCGAKMVEPQESEES